MSLINLLRKNHKKALFTTPSHDRGFFIVHKFMQFYKKDISETDTHNPVEALEKAQERAAKIYGVKYTKFLTNGSTSGIIAAVLSCVAKGDKVLIWSKAHKCHKNAVELAGAEPVFYELPNMEDWGIFGRLVPNELEKMLKNGGIKAVIVTSPSYEGIVSDIPEIAKICAKYNVKLIVDEAHGALYLFSAELPETSVGVADFTVQSLHKTAGGLNPTALLHSKEADPQPALDKINTTSPSYPLLMSIEANINFLNSQSGKKKITKLISDIRDLRKNCTGVEFGGDDITKILVKIPNLAGTELSEILYNDFDIEDERTNSVSTMLLTGIGTTDKKLKKLEFALKKISERAKK